MFRLSNDRFHPYPSGCSIPWHQCQWSNHHVYGPINHRHGPLTRYIILRVAHVPGMPGAFPRHCGLVILTCITARAWRTCRDACRDRWLAISFEVGGGENVPGIPGACATRNFAYLVRGPRTGNIIAPIPRITEICYGINPLINIGSIGFARTRLQQTRYTAVFSYSFKWLSTIANDI